MIFYKSLKLLKGSAMVGILGLDFKANLLDFIKYYLPNFEYSF